MKIMKPLWPDFGTGHVFHYTSFKGLEGILKDKAIWATEIRCQKDPEELTYPLGIAKTEIKRLRQLLNADDVKYLDQIESELTLIELQLTNTTKLDGDGIYVCSFSTQGDKLSQWRDYADKGRGVSIGFDLTKIPIADQDFEPFECVYLEAEHSKHIQDFLRQRLCAARNYAKAGGTGKIEPEGLGFHSREFLRTAPILKRPQFREEKEWRLISREKPPGDARVKRRRRDSETVRYFELDLVDSKSAPLSIPELIIGPAAPSSSEVFITELLAKANIKNCKVRRSSIPLSSLGLGIADSASE